MTDLPQSVECREGAVGGKVAACIQCASVNRAVELDPDADSAVKALSEDKREQLKQIVKSKVPVDPNGVIAYLARVNAVRGRV